MDRAKPVPVIEGLVREDRISALHDDLLIQILLLVPTKDAVATTLLSKRWRFVWTKLHRLDFIETRNRDEKSVWWFLDQSMRLYDAPFLEKLCIKLGTQCPVDVDVVNWVAKAIDCCVRDLTFQLLWYSEPIRMPQSLYTCKTLTKLNLSETILVDVPSPVSLPSLTQLVLLSVLYKEEDSHVRLLSGCPVLKHLKVIRGDSQVGIESDTVRKFSVKVPSLLELTYADYRWHDRYDDPDWSLVIDTPNLEFLDISDGKHTSCSTKYMPHLVKALISVYISYPDDNFLRFLSSIKYLELRPPDIMLPWSNAVNYSRLIECSIFYFDPDWCESLVVLLSNCPKLKVLMVDSTFEIDWEFNNDPVLWNRPSSVPRCLSSHLEIFEWTAYSGRENEKELIRYILENSECLKTAGISLSYLCHYHKKQKIIEELQSMPRVSTSSEILFSATLLFRHSYDDQ